MRRIPAWLRGGTMLAAAAMAWGGMFPVVKPLMQSLDPFGLTLVRYGLAAPVFLALLWAAEGRHAFATEGQALRLWWSGTLGFAGFGLFAFVGLESTRPEHAAVIPALLPLISVVVISARQQAWPSARAILAIAVGLGGVALVVTLPRCSPAGRGGARHWSWPAPPAGSSTPSAPPLSRAGRGFATRR